MGLPMGVLIVIIKRKQAYITPRGDTEIESGDKLTIMMDNKEEMKVVKACLGIM